MTERERIELELARLDGRMAELEEAVTAAEAAQADKDAAWRDAAIAATLDGAPEKDAAKAEADAQRAAWATRRAVAVRDEAARRVGVLRGQREDARMAERLAELREMQAAEPFVVRQYLGILKDYLEQCAAMRHRAWAMGRLRAEVSRWAASHGGVDLGGPAFMGLEVVRRDMEPPDLGYQLRPHGALWAEILGGDA